MHQFGWLSERGGNFLNLLQKEEDTQKGGGGGATLEETMNVKKKTFHSTEMNQKSILKIAFLENYIFHFNLHSCDDIRP